MIQGTSFVKAASTNFYINTNNISTIQKQPQAKGQEARYTVTYTTLDDRGQNKNLRVDIDEKAFKNLNIVA